jgi:hypothetical protein
MPHHDSTSLDNADHHCSHTTTERTPSNLGLFGQQGGSCQVETPEFRNLADVAETQKIA